MAIVTLRAALAAAGLLSLAGCGAAALDPAPLPVDRAVCARCGMLVSDPRSAAQAVRAGEDPRFYDDPGCLAGDPDAGGGGAEIYVATENGWVRAAEAFFARPEYARTPMGYGFIAFAGKTEAQARDAASRARSWDEVVSRARQQGRHATN